MGYRGLVLARTQFTIPSDQWQTKGEQITLGTTQLPFDFYRDVNGVWRVRSKWEATYAAAKAWMLAALAQADLSAEPQV